MHYLCKVKRNAMSKSVIFSRRYAAVLVATVIALALTCWRCSHRTRYYEDSGVVWTTMYHITYEASAPLTDSIQAVLDAVDRSASAYAPASLLSRLNTNATDTVDAIIERLQACAEQVHSASDGLYDPTVRPLVRLWGFGDDGLPHATRAQVDSVLQFVGLGKVRIAGGRLVKADPRVQLDYSSIAKGLACDLIGEMLARNGAENYIVEIGGEVASAGVNRQGQPWVVSIDAPLVSDTVVHESLIKVRAGGGGIATSGNYRRWRAQDANSRISHIINPVTGDASVGDLVSATVIAGDCMTADAWSTACMAMGAERVQAKLGDCGEA